MRACEIVDVVCTVWYCFFNENDILESRKYKLLIEERGVSFEVIAEQIRKKKILNCELNSQMRERSADRIVKLFLKQPILKL